MLLGGCVYYNGMYNAKRLASSARRAERDGRTFEANNLWGQVITRADTLLARHPDSKYVDEAMVLKGMALARLNQCEAALASAWTGGAPPVPIEEVVEDATLALGRCHLGAGEPRRGGTDVRASGREPRPDPASARQRCSVEGVAV